MHVALRFFSSGGFSLLLLILLLVLTVFSFLFLPHLPFAFLPAKTKLLTRVGCTMASWLRVVTGVRSSGSKRTKKLSSVRGQRFAYNNTNYLLAFTYLNIPCLQDMELQNHPEEDSFSTDKHASVNSLEKKKLSM